ncbi:DeoR/GlpR family DNA-binding transcription regulator [Nocardioides sp.]|uniref:DeoR/GlpR family DNA-binding transcription regulator n=1 Tax=Nocardioides sp. TaxID=35761 RepID=UPI002B86C17C|nr:DeoR/GlpR family DNA-binding transcription regulator [Nocardioides sp.]HVX55626.1 DeoR/GlpR family DNA-binding transcription regulator [Nocardioides sp.]
MKARPREKPIDRQQQIADFVVANGSVSARDLAEQFGVSLMTVHRDLDELESRGVVRKHRGGVTAQPSSIFESHLAYRLGRCAEEKREIAVEARKLVEPGMAVMLDDSTSALALAHLLHDALPLTIITNFLEIISLVTAWADARLIVLGGEYHAAHQSFLGVPCVEAIGGLRADLLFTSSSTVDERFVYHQEQDIVFVKRAMLTAAAKRVLLVDHTKLGRPALHRLAPLGDFDEVITDRGASPEEVRRMRDRGVSVTVAASMGTKRGRPGGVSSSEGQ